MAGDRTYMKNKSVLPTGTTILHLLIGSFPQDNNFDSRVIYCETHFKNNMDI